MSLHLFTGAVSSFTADGIGLSMFGVILMIWCAALPCHRVVSVFCRHIPVRILMTDTLVCTDRFALIMVGARVVMFSIGCAFVDAVFLGRSDISLGDYSAGVARSGNPATLFNLSALMIVVRLGSLSISFSIGRQMGPVPI